MTLFQLTRLPPNVAGRQRVLDSDICWIFGIFLSYCRQQSDQLAWVLCFSVSFHTILQLFRNCSILRHNLYSRSQCCNWTCKEVLKLISTKSTTKSKHITETSNASNFVESVERKPIRLLVIVVGLSLISSLQNLHTETVEDLLSNKSYLNKFRN